MTQPAPSPCAGARFRADRAAGSRSQNAPGLLDLFDRELGFLHRSLGCVQLRIGRFGIAVAKRREDFSLRRLALRKRRVGVAPAFDELEPLGPMGRHLPPDRLDASTLTCLASAQSEATRSIRAEQTVGLPVEALPDRSVFPSGRRSSGRQPVWLRPSSESRSPWYGLVGRPSLVTASSPADVSLGRAP